MSMAAGNPEVERAVATIEATLKNHPLVPEDLDKAIQMLEFVLQHPDKYGEVRQAAIADGLIDESIFPLQYNKTLVISVLIALYGLQDSSAKNMAKGGLATAARRVAAAGRGGDTMLAHINPREAEMLRRVGGSGTVNPSTGLREYKGGLLGSVLSVVVPIAATILAPGLGTVLSSTLGVGAEVGGALAGAALGAGSSAITGGNIAQGAIFGGLGSGLGKLVGKQANLLGLGEVSDKTANVIGSGLLGGAAGAATGKGFGAGLQQGVMGGALGNLAEGIGGTGALSKGLTAAGTGMGNALTAGYDPKQAAMMGAGQGALAGISNALGSAKPSDAVVDNTGNYQDSLRLDGQAAPSSYQDNIRLGGTQTGDFTQRVGGLDTALPSGVYVNPLTADSLPVMGTETPTGNWQDQSGNLRLPSGIEAQQNLANISAATPATSATVGGADKMNLLNAGLTGAALYGGLTSNPVPEDIPNAPELSPTQKEYFNRPTLTWDWTKAKADATAANQSLGQYVAKNWDKFTGGYYNVVAPSTSVAYKARGGALSAIAGYAQGGGDGRADTIDARLSDGEYVIDAETVALLGNGSNKAGAQRLDQMRSEIRKQKGKTLAKGKISPNAKSPLAYIKEIA